jgi:hypothetical protein
MSTGPAIEQLPQADKDRLYDMLEGMKGLDLIDFLLVYIDKQGLEEMLASLDEATQTGDG